MDDPFDLARFVAAQDGVYDTALAELQAGRKRTHWMWFVLPQLRGLGSSPTAERYGLSGVDEARAYLAHPVLGPRYRACVDAVNGLQGRTAHEVFGSPDDLKFRSSLTLFLAAAPGESAFRKALDAFYGGEPDPRTLERLGSDRRG
jgi:uncharacterized protein (DUF1810 family)